MQDIDRSGHEFGRRAFLRGAAATSAAVAAARGRLNADDADARPFGPAGLIARQKGPDNLEFPFSTLESFLTPNAQFYVRTHFEVPRLDAATWRLKVEGAVERPLELSLDELRQLPSRRVAALLECSGNGRVFLKPPQIGIRWELGGVSNAEWAGVPLATVLDRAGVHDGAVEVILQGADRGKFEEPEPRTPGVIPYARSLPLTKARQPEVILAYRMNGEELPPAHGYPVRVIVPGWYGMASVKWLTRVIVTDRPFDGYFQSFMYTIWERRHGLPSLVPVTELEVKAEIARPAPHEVVARGSEYRVFGAAWTGESEVTKVEFSADGGTDWAEAKLLGEPVRYAWRFWEYAWQTPARAGRYPVMARATDGRGRVQPTKRDEDRRDAVISHVLPIEVEVR
ncbi:MAG: sulfite oxidase [Acidimicrobiia bacterium]|nr:sulfite oxidase [Acidimicrobiia bacterium]